MTKAQAKALDLLASKPKSGVPVSDAAGVTKTRINRQTAVSLAEQGLVELDWTRAMREEDHQLPTARITERGKAARE